MLSGIRFRASSFCLVLCVCAPFASFEVSYILPGCQGVLQTHKHIFESSLIREVVPVKGYIASDKISIESNKYAAVQLRMITFHDAIALLHSTRCISSQTEQQMCFLAQRFSKGEMTLSSVEGKSIHITESDGSGAGTWTEPPRPPAPSPSPRRVLLCFVTFLIMVKSIPLRVCMHYWSWCVCGCVCVLQCVASFTQ